MKSRIGFWIIPVLILAYAMSSCQHNNEAPPTPFEAADSGIGGVMYNQFWAEESGFDQNDPNIPLFEANSDFFRCKQCHAWDGLGNGGSYISRGPNATRPKVAALNLYESAQTKTPEELFEALKRTDGRRALSYDLSQYDPQGSNEEGDKMPDLTQFLSDQQLWDLAKFLKDGMFNVSELYDGTYQGLYPLGQASYSNLGKNGSESTGQNLYADKCAGCHGEDGTAFPIDGKGVGGFTRNKPYEVQHKIKYGELGTSMVGEFDMTLDEMRDMYKALASETNFPDEPPLTEISFVNDVEPIFYTGDKCTSCHKPSGIASFLDLTQGNAFNSINSSKYINLADPASSLIYTKPQGGHPANYSAAESNIVLTWIAQGALNN